MNGDVKRALPPCHLQDLRTSLDAPIRPAASADCPVLTRIVNESNCYPGMYRALAGAVRVTPAVLLDRIVRVHDDGTAVRGFFSVEQTAAGSSLDLMFVDNGWTGRGIGRMLFNDLVQTVHSLHYRGILIISHPPAQGFYLHMGARLTGIEPPGKSATWTRPRLWYDIPVQTRNESVG